MSDSVDFSSLSLYKVKTSSLADQSERRKEFLARQREKRETLLSSLRFSSSPAKESSRSQWPPRRPTAPIGLMLAEWLFSPPEDLSSWFVIGCPRGQRCLVVVHSHRAQIFNRHGRMLRTLNTSLPKQTILSCIYDQRSSVYHLLDLLMWNGQDYSTQVECQCRFFMLLSLVGDPRLSTHFSVLPRRTVDEPSDWLPAEDGYLFYHPLGFYESGYSPLVCWLKPFMLEEILQRTTPFAGEKPVGYSTAHAFMLDEQAKRKEQEESHAMSVDG